MVRADTEFLQEMEMITKLYEIVCDNCERECYYFWSTRTAERAFRKDGGIISKKKHFCDKKCKDEYFAKDF